MKFKPFMTLYALVSIVFGLGFVIAPGLLLSIYGVQTDAAFDYVSRLFGAALVSLAALTWLLRGAPASEARQTVTLSLLIGEALAFVLSLIGQAGGVFNPLGWSVVLVYGLLSAGLAYLYFVKPGA